MTVIFLILKIIFIIFISLISLILATGILFIAVPIRYKTFGIYDENKEFTLYLSWLFKLLSFKFQYKENDKKSEFKIMGIRLGKRKKIKKIKEEDTPSNNKEENIVKEPELNEKTEKSREKSKKTAEKNIKSVDTETEDIEIDLEDASESSGIINTINNIVEKIKYYYNYPDRDELIRLGKDFLKKSLKTFKVKIFFLKGRIGFESPDHTAYAIGALSVFNAWIKKPYYIQVTPDFQEEKINLSIDSKGNIYLGRLCVLFIRFVLKKPVWKLVKKYFL
ncbi:MAG: DUF2953 domain-containing protein [Lachnospiraceae bacterium]|nr:DUF2953 domain-containing protein [Lachnospiraceae bacterium]